MSYGTFQGIMTLVIMALFIGIVIWAYSSRRNKAFDEAANSIFDEDTASETIKKQEAEG